MPIQILMPALSPTMEDGTLARWHVKEGDAVTAGDVIAEIETDKATMEVEAIDEGTVGKILIGEGTEHVAVNAPIAILLEEGEDGGSLAAYSDPAPLSSPVAPMPEAPPAAASPAPDAATPMTSSPVQNHFTNGQTMRPIASPLARRLAKDYDIDLTHIKGSGPNGRIVRDDIEAILRAGHTMPEKSTAKTPAGELPDIDHRAADAGMPEAPSAPERASAETAWP
ncbi:MAG: biotin/lipoyl-containing protein, partial [Methyloligellaceae bacterium]